jgi:flagellar motor protein MotB
MTRVGALRVTGIDLTNAPLKVDIGEIAVSDYTANVVVEPDKSLNWTTIMPAKPSGTGDAKATVQPPAVTNESTAAAAATTAAPAVAPATASRENPPAVHVRALVLDRGTINLEDRSTHPAFATTLSQLSGRVAGLSFDEGERATVNLTGKLGNGPLEIMGRLNPLAKKPFLDVVFRLADVDLSAMTPYSGQYAGYAIEKGQLYLDLKYLIDARRLDAKNEVKLSQFTFGQSVKSKDATGLPVRLAVSLLKDRHGVIQLDIPVSGSLDDPKFSVWGVVWQVLKNLLVKAATSPFALLGSLFGQGEELAWLEFEPGRAEVPAAGRPKLVALGKALYERPGLRLEVEGHADPASDTVALRRLELRRKVKAQKVLETVAGGGDASQNVVVAPSEYSKYLKRAYRADEKTKKPTNALGMLRDLPDAEMERLMLAAITISQDDLRLLARQRAQTAREQILRVKKIDTERVFLIEPKSLLPLRKEKVANTRVDFRLQ